MNLGNTHFDTLSNAISLAGGLGLGLNRQDFEEIVKYAISLTFSIDLWHSCPVNAYIVPKQAWKEGNGSC